MCTRELYTSSSAVSRSADNNGYVRSRYRQPKSSDGNSETLSSLNDKQNVQQCVKRPPLVGHFSFPRGGENR